jgi:hypothetical protein
MRPIWETLGVTEADVRKVTQVPDRDEVIVHLWNWRKTRISSLQRLRGRL